MFTVNTKTKEKGSGSEKGVIFGSHVLFTDSNYAGIGSWKAVKATGTITVTGQPADGDTFVLGLITYRFKNTIAQANDILIGANLAATQANIVAAINGDQTLIGTSYHATTRPNPGVSASAFVANVSTLTALYGGIAGNLIVLTESATNVTVSGAGFLTGGLAETAADSILFPSNEQYNVSSYATISQSLFSNGLGQETSQLARRYARIATDYDVERLYTTGQSKKKTIANNFNQNYKKMSKVSIQSLLKENPSVTLGFNHNAILKVKALNATQFIVQSTAQTQFQVLTIAADGTVTVGSLFTHSQVVHDWDVVDSAVSPYKIVGIRNIGATSYEHQYFTVSGTTMSHSASTTFTVTGSGSATLLFVSKIATGKAVMIYRNNTTTFGMRVLDVTGAPSLGSEVSITPTNIGSAPSIVNYDTDKYAVFTASNSSVAQIYIGNVTGTSIAIGSAYTSTVNISLDTIQTPDSFSAVAVNNANIVFTAYQSTSVAGQVNFLEQIAITGTTASLINVFKLKSNSTWQAGGIRILSVGSGSYGVYINNPTTLDGYYDTNQIMIPFVVTGSGFSGTTVTVPKSYKKEIGILNTPLFTTPNKFLLAVGIYFVNMAGGGSASLSAPVLVQTPVAVELYNHETLMGTVTTTYPFVESVLNLDGVSAADINDASAYLKVKNTGAQTHAIDVVGVLVEME